MSIGDIISGALLALWPWIPAIFWMALALVLAHLLVLKYLAPKYSWLERTEPLFGAMISLCFVLAQVAVLLWI